MLFNSDAEAPLSRPSVGRRQIILTLGGLAALALPKPLNAAQGNPMISLDHVALAVRDLDAADRLLRDRNGLGSVEGGAHPQWGTANRIVPLGRHFIEVVGIANAELAASNPVGQIILQQTRDGDRFVGICLATPDKAATAERLGIKWVEGSRDTKAGRLSFRSAGIERAMFEGAGWPYFFEYDDAKLRLGAGDPRHTVRPMGIARVEVSQKADRLRAFVGPGVPELIINEGPPEIHRVVIAVDGGEIVLPGRL